jgi:hypothetical protein
MVSLISSGGHLALAAFGAIFCFYFCYMQATCSLVLVQGGFSWGVFTSRKVGEKLL